MAGTRWNPWRALRAREHLELRWGRLRGCRGRIEEHAPGARTVWLDHRLDRRTRSAVLGHELVHDELDLLFEPGAPPALVAKVEAHVERVTVDRLVPPDELAAWIAEQPEWMQVTARATADEFDVPVDVADLALRRLASGF